MLTATSLDDLVTAYLGLAEVGVALFDECGRILRTNDNLERLLGCRGGQLLQTSYFELSHPDDRESESAAFSALTDGGQQTYALEKRLLLGAHDLAHYQGVLHVECMVTRYRYQEKMVFLALMQEMKIYRHFKTRHNET
ncbi:MAG: PAS domain-containing protein [Alphaproteobacteria bacterium]|nr:PAS domain-containing protein [Alphaproteobacteria bacterium]MBF0355815.1 PAS domain-containing protein [Alphaproteobacteria bacterium]